MIKPVPIHTNDYLTKSKLPGADYVINPYVGCPHKCKYCYAEFMRRFTGHVEPWGDFLDVKISDKELSHKKLTGKTVLFGSVTDCYNGFESEYKITRGLLEQLIGVDSDIQILTKSNLVVRDIDILKQLKNVRVAFSVNTLDDGFRADMEPFASSISARIEALKEIRHHGIKTAIFISPIFPGITDCTSIVDALKEYADEFWFENLNMYPSIAPRIMQYIKNRRPELLPLYIQIYQNGNITFWQELQDSVTKYCTENNINCKIYFHHKQIKKQ